MTFSMDIIAKYTPFVLFVCLFMACNSTKKANVVVAPDLEIENLDTMVITAPRELEEEVVYEPSIYNPSPTRRHDLLHTILDVRFNWPEEQVIGKATLRLSPYFYPSSELVLDAKNFKVNHIRLDGTDLVYQNNGQQLLIDLGREYNKEEEYTIEIDYVATPRPSGGSAAITSDRGLFFVNPRGDEEGVPQQIWTQGETEHNSHWFPTIDKPNERCTQEMFITVDKKYEVLSNGTLQGVEANTDGTQTHHWELEQPHAPYLFMLAIGEFAVVEESWEGRPVTYYVEPEYEADARAIFAHTKEMLDFFSDYTGVKYPWPKYAQVVVREFVSGAMENTTGVIFGDFVQRHRRELIDDHNDKIVAHELFHHWFGDLVTCESWANLTMNEGFANYGEYLWLEHKYGRDEADYHLLGEWSGYYNSAQGGIHPLIHFAYDDKEDMFDAHSYNKGGSVLHMLRHYVGDEAFRAALNKYLTDNAYTAVEAHNLRLAFEEVTGEDLNWFFRQWYFSQGHPMLSVEYGYDEANQQASITVTQQQDPEEMPAIFQLPVAVDIYTEAGQAPRREQIFVQEREQTFTFDISTRPQLMTFDADRMLLAQIDDNKQEAQYIFQYNHAPRLYDRYEALQYLRDSNNPEVAAIFDAALRDDFWVVRGFAITQLGDNPSEAVRQRLTVMAERDPHSQVRSTAFEILTELQDDRAVQAAQSAIQKDSSYTVMGAALAYLGEFDKPAALEAAQMLENEKAADLLMAVGKLYAEQGDTSKLAFFERSLPHMNGLAAIYFLEDYQNLVLEAAPSTVRQSADRLIAIALDPGKNTWVRYGSTSALSKMRAAILEGSELGYAGFASELKQELLRIKEEEGNPQLRSFYEQLLQGL